MCGGVGWGGGQVGAEALQAGEPEGLGAVLKWEELDLRKGLRPECLELCDQRGESHTMRQGRTGF